MPFNPVEALGVPQATLEGLSTSQRELLDQLTEHEVAVITSIQQRFNAVTGEVSAQGLDQPAVNFACIAIS